MMKNLIIAGVDEAGRGALSGPVVAGAVILSDDFDKSILADSKKMTDKRRRESLILIKKDCIWGYGVVEANEIDKIGIKKATNKAMQLAVKSLSKQPQKLLIDGCDRFVFEIKSEDIIKGDEKIPSISAGSIVAKVLRDDIMIEYSKKYPEFHFKDNKGYGSALHLELIEKEIYTDIHRKSYDPLKTRITQGRLF